METNFSNLKKTKYHESIRQNEKKKKFKNISSYPIRKVNNMLSNLYQVPQFQAK